MDVETDAMRGECSRITRLRGVTLHIMPGRAPRARLRAARLRAPARDACSRGAQRRVHGARQALRGCRLASVSLHRRAARTPLDIAAPEHRPPREARSVVVIVGGAAAPAAHRADDGRERGGPEAELLAGGT